MSFQFVRKLLGCSRFCQKQYLFGFEKGQEYLRGIEALQDEKNDFCQKLSKVKSFSFSFPKQSDIQYQEAWKMLLQHQKYFPFSILKKKKPCANRRAFHLSIFLRLKTTYTWLLACLENHRRLCKAPRPDSTLCFKTPNRHSSCLPP